MSETKTVRKANVILYVTLLFWVCILAWANFAVLEEVTRGQGRVMASSRIQIIQNLEGGIIKDIVVKPGDRVSSGDPLVYLETTLYQSELVARQKEKLAAERNLELIEEERDILAPLV